MMHAEIDEVWPRGGKVRIVGRMHGHAPEGSGWQLLLVLRDREAEQLRYGAMLEGEAFEASLPVDDLALDGLHRATWDLHLSSGAGADEVRLRVGKQLDDIRGKKKIYVFPAQSVTSDEDGTVVRPFYTINDNLSLECLPGDVELREGEIEIELPEWID